MITPLDFSSRAFAKRVRNSLLDQNPLFLLPGFAGPGLSDGNCPSRALVHPSSAARLVCTLSSLYVWAPALGEACAGAANAHSPLTASLRSQSGI